MKLNQLMADLKAIPSNRWDLPIQVYDFTSIFQIAEIGVMHYCFSDSTILLVTGLQAKKITAKELIGALDLLSTFDGNLDIEVFLDDGNQHILAGVEFDRKNQTYAITLGDKISWRSSGINYDEWVLFYQ